MQVWDYSLHYVNELLSRAFTEQYKEFIIYATQQKFLIKKNKNISKISDLFLKQPGKYLVVVMQITNTQVTKNTQLMECTMTQL